MLTKLILKIYLICSKWIHYLEDRVINYSSMFSTTVVKIVYIYPTWNPLRILTLSVLKYKSTLKFGTQDLSLTAMVLKSKILKISSWHITHGHTCTSVYAKHSFSLNSAHMYTHKHTFRVSRRFHPFVLDNYHQFQK